MLGALIGDVIGSVYEIRNVKSEDFKLFSPQSHFTDDSVLTLAVAQKLLNDKKNGRSNKSAFSYAMWYKQYYRRYPYSGFGQMFEQWARSEYLYIQKSFGNGGAMRVVPIGYACDSIKQVKREVSESCYYTHHNSEAINYAYAVALAVFLAHHECDKDEIRKTLRKHTRINLNFSLDDIRKSYVFDSRAKNSVPQAIVAFLEGSDYESTVRKAVSIGGDSDTIACMAGGIAEAYYKKIPDEIVLSAYRYLDGSMKNLISQFKEFFM